MSEDYLSDLIEGSFEIEPVILHKSTGHVDEYPLFEKIKAVDVGQLVEDYHACKDRLSSQYLADRIGHSPLSLERNLTLMNQYGFTPETYTCLSLLQVGKKEFNPEVPHYTRELLSSFSTFCFRAHYAIATPGWDAKFHRDYDNFRVQGFRIHIPVTAPLYFGFQENDEPEKKVILEPNQAWFMNAARRHRAYNPTSNPRVSITFQLTSDVEILPAKSV